MVSFCQSTFKEYAEICISMANGDKNITATHIGGAFFGDLMGHLNMHEMVKLHWIQWNEDELHWMRVSLHLYKSLREFFNTLDLI